MVLRGLADENSRSMQYRYGDAHVASTLVYSPSAVPLRFRLSVDPLVILKGIRCLEYQSCEHPGWKTSSSAEFLRELTDYMVYRLPGYEAAPSIG